jgi:hypothetical protein
MNDMQFNGVIIPKRIVGALNRYVVDRTPTGGFLRSVLENDLVGATSQADDECLLILPSIVKYVYNELPGNTWGNKEKVARWLKGTEE